MPEQQVDSLQLLFVAGALLLSISTGFYLIVRSSRGLVLRYEPRRPVPWGPIASALVVFALLSTFSAAWEQLRQPETTAKLAEDQPAEQAQHDGQAEEDASSEVAGQAGGAALLVFVTVGFVFIIAVLYRATPRDLGLPTSLKQFACDTLIGAIACVAALAPVHVLQVMLRYLLQMEQGKSGHELIRMITEGKPSITLLIVATVLAVIVAPLCEELVFRLLFQGWLEKWEDDRLGWRSPPLRVIVPEADAELPTSIEPPVEQTLPLDPPQHGLVGLPYGWTPIIISATVFGLAHLGYGPEPVPIFVLGLFLGYVYQRSHRIAPSIVCHALFNLFTVSQIWWMYFVGAHPK